MDSVLTTLEAELTGVLQRLSEAETQLCFSGKWTIQQIAEHLVLTYKATASVLAERLGKGRATRTRSTPAQHFFRLWVVELGRFPNGRAAPPFVCSCPGGAPKAGRELVLDVGEALHQMQDQLHQVSAIFGSQQRSASHVVLGPLAPRQWEKFHLVHGRHHIRQIEKILAGGSAHALVL